MEKIPRAPVATGRRKIKLSDQLVDEIAAEVEGLQPDEARQRRR